MRDRGLKFIVKDDMIWVSVPSLLRWDSLSQDTYNRFLTEYNDVLLELEKNKELNERKE